jgi:hypothetical protein
MPDCMRYLLVSLLLAALMCQGAALAAEDELPAGVRSALQVRAVPIPVTLSWHGCPRSRVILHRP